MQTLRMFGGISLSNADRSEADNLLRQPKQLALLAYLALPRPGTWHRRDSLLGVFWPELDQSRARTSLRSALYALRRQLVEGSIRTRGDDEVSIDPALLSTDVGLMLDDLDAGRHSDALSRYAGDLLPGFYVAGAEGFEPWLTQERKRLRELAQKAAVQLTNHLESSSDLAGALEAARKAADLDANDEASARRLIALLDSVGDRAQAFAVYERFRNHIRAEFGVPPSAETTALIEAVRTRRAASGVLDRSANRDPLERAAATQTATPAAVGNDSASRLSARSRRRWVGIAAAVAITAVALAAAYRGVVAGSLSRGRDAAVLVVLPVENETGDPAQDYIAAGIADEVGRRLDRIGGLRVRSGALAKWPASVRHDLRRIGRQFGARSLLRTTLAKVGDSFELRATVIDAEARSESALPSRRFALSDVRRVESDLTAAVWGALFRVAMPTVPRPPDHPIDPESYRLTLQGWHDFLTLRQVETAKERFLKATELDRTNARAFAGLSSAIAAQTVTEQIPFDIGYDHASAAAARAIALDSLQGTAWANLGGLQALRTGNLAAGVAMIQTAKRVEPSNPEVFLISAALYRHAHLWDKALDDMRVARELDPLTPLYVTTMAGYELCADRPEAAISELESELQVVPSNVPMLKTLVVALARVGRYDDAIAAWRKQAAEERDTMVAVLLDSARGAKGYWSVRHAEGRRRLLGLEQERRHGPTSPIWIMQARFAAGDADGGFALLDSLARLKTSALYKLPCFPDLEEVRATPRYAAAIKQIGVLR
jgi:DNA-binding SARP family transcriptional activator/TolB-like protein